MRSEPRPPSWRNERGVGRPPAIFWLILCALIAWGGIGWMKGYWKTKDFEGRVRSTILLNPTMKDGEMLYHLKKEAVDAGVTLDEESIKVSRGGNTALAAGGISAVSVRYTVPYSVLVFDYEQQVKTRVTP